MFANIIHTKHNWQNIIGGNVLDFDSVPINGDALLVSSGVNSQSISVPRIESYKMTGNDQSQSDRYPQGVAEYGDYIITSWYFKYAPLSSACYLRVYNRLDGRCFTLGLLVASGGTLYRINSHVGGIAVKGDFLYIIDDPMFSVRVFDLRNVFSKISNTSIIDMADAYNFGGTYNYFLPQVARFEAIGSPAPFAYMSLTVNDEFVIGNYYSASSNSYNQGGKSMIWVIPTQIDEIEGYLVPMNAYQQIEPQYADGTTIQHIQGALVHNSQVVISRGGSATQKQLIVLDGFYGTADNWLYGCEDLSFNIETNRMIVVTEFITRREIAVYHFDEILALGTPALPPTIEQHQAIVAMMEEQKYAYATNVAYWQELYDAAQGEITFYNQQIASAISEGLTRFDHDTYLVQQ